VPEPVRIALRLLGLLLLLAALACAVLLAWPGPTQVADVLGVSCAHSRHSGPEQCSWLDAADLLWTGVWLFAVVGAVLRLVTRPKGRGPRTLDLRRLRSR
jgi:hypothetical protein